MAATTSFRKGQVPICCHLCETETKLSWKCIDCDLLMCNGCKERIHTKIRNARNHKVIDIKEVGSHSEEFDFSNIHCKEHIKGQVCVMFCKSCDRLVCTQCIAKVHTGHRLVEMNEGCQIKIEQLRTSVDTLEKEEGKVKDIEKTENANFTNVKKQILDQNVSLKTSVDQHTEVLLKELDQKWESFKKSTEKVESKIISLKKSQKVKTQHIEDIINSNNAEQIFEECNTLEESLKEVSESLKLNSNATPVFLPGQIRRYNVGSLQNTSTDITLQVIKEYTADISNLYDMSRCDDSLWISDMDTLQKVQPEQNNLKIISNFKIKVSGMAVTPSDDLLIVVAGETVLKNISASTNTLTDTNYSVYPLALITVHVTIDYKVVVGVKSFGDIFPVTGRRAVVMMDKEGKQKTIYEYDTNNQRIFTFPSNITSTYNGNICVLDKLSDDDRRIVVLGQGGDILNIYNGHPDINTKDRPFRPVSLVSTPSDNIITSERQTTVLHILNNVGHYKTHINTRDIGIEDPYSIIFTKSKMYIGSVRTKGITDKAKLYEVKLTGC